MNKRNGLLLFGMLTCMFGCHSWSSFPTEQKVLDSFVVAIEHERYDEALQYCWNAEVVIRPDGSKCLSFRSSKPVNNHIVGKLAGSEAIIEHPDSWNAQEARYRGSWRLIRMDEWLKPSKCFDVDVPPDSYVLITASDVAVGFTCIDGSPKICFTRAHLLG
jgi:hypothetical protein